MKKLSEDRLDHFNVDNVEKYVGWDTIESMIRNQFLSSSFCFLDIGGGNGAFADRILEIFPASQGTVIDNAHYQLDLNSPHPRKSTLQCSVNNMTQVLGSDRFDLIFYHWVLHHFVEKTYRESLVTISNALSSGRQLLSNRGVISILENCYKPVLSKALPSKIIYHTTSSKLLAAVMRLVGVNSAGTGICYLSISLWLSMLKKNGFSIEKCERMRPLQTSQLKSWLVLSKGIDIVHFVGTLQD
ncbi:MAG: class I SAM-dependent methyltransferase [Anaerolineae bacterium]|nr:class I SAM-dependent methyltransferase [Anaerolineae bacterium]